MKRLLTLALVLVSSSLLAETNSERIANLEKRVAKLEALVKPVAAEQKARKGRDELISQARVRMRKDSKVYSRDELREIETLYQVANKKWRSDEGKESLKKLIAKYDKANRTGCALLYLGQMSKGDQQFEYLSRAVKDFSDCCYGNGVQVGAYARFLLAQVYLNKDKKDEAKKLFQEIKTNYPDSITHRGKSLVDIIEKQIEPKMK